MAHISEFYASEVLFPCLNASTSRCGSYLAYDVCSACFLCFNITERKEKTKKGSIESHSIPSIINILTKKGDIVTHVFLLRTNDLQNEMIFRFFSRRERNEIAFYQIIFCGRRTAFRLKVLINFSCLLISVFSLLFAECLFGKTLRELGSKWYADLGPPFGVMYCIMCECVPVSGFGCSPR